MSRDERTRLADIAEALELIQSYRERAATVDGARDDQFLGDAVLLRLIVIGEAVKSLTPETCAGAPEIDWAAWARQRDLISHRYFRIDMPTIWNTVDTDVPALAAAIERLLEDAG